MANENEWIVEDESANLRLDAFLVKHYPQFSRSKIQRSIAKGNATVDGRPGKASLRLTTGSRVVFSPPEWVSEAPIPEDLPLEVLFEDEHLVAINKPPAMVVHPAKGNWKGTLTSALAFRYEQLSDLGGVARPGIVHRLDRDTSGVILVARTNKAHASLSSQFEQRTVNKKYWALVSPAPDRDRDLIDQPIGAHPYQREKKAIRANHSTSKSAQSFYEVVERFRGFAVVHVAPRTGRTHQIRVHMAHVGCPVLCDRLYSGRAALRTSDALLASERNKLDSADDQELLGRQALHALQIEFEHPETGNRIEVKAPKPDDLNRALNALREHRRLEK